MRAATARSTTSRPPSRSRDRRRRFPAIPNGYTVEGDVKLKTPLSATLFSPVSTNAGGGGKKLVAQFSKADIDNNTPEGDSVPLVLTVNVLQNGVQKQLSSTALVKVEK